jgi:type I restriction enzyme S subunit
MTCKHQQIAVNLRRLGMREVLLGELLSDKGITYGVVKPGDHSPNGIPLIKAADVGNGRVNASPAFKISQDKHQEHCRTELTGGELLITLVGTPGQCAIAPVEIKGFNVVRAVGVFNVEPIADNHYMMYAIQGQLSQSYIRNVCNTTVQATLNLGDLKGLPLSIPPLAEQKAIAHILGTLDDKIELNRKTNETLEAMAKALFKSWFVDFDPVRAKAEGRPTGLPAEISDLFPDSFEDSGLGEIPCGWRVGSLDQIGINPRETAKPGEMNSSDRYIGLEHMPRESICLGESGQAEDLESNKNRFKQGDLLFGKLRPYFKKTGYAQFDGVCSTDIVVVRKKGEYGVGFICCFLASDPFIDFTVAASSGTRMPRSSWKDMCEFPFAIPSKILLREFDNQFCSTINKVTFNCILSASLAALRDALLPKLISGEIRIPDAEKMLEEVDV